MTASTACAIPKMAIVDVIWVGWDQSAMMNVPVESLVPTVATHARVRTTLSVIPSPVAADVLMDITDRTVIEVRLLRSD